MKDGTPLLEKEQPNFVEMPSESLDAVVDEDDAGEVTVIRRNIPVPPPVEDARTNEPRAAERIVVPTYQDPQRQAGRPVPAPRKTNTAAVVLLTIFGTVAVLGLIGGAIWLFSGGRSDSIDLNVNANANADQNVNVNTNLGFDTNFNFNINANTNSNVNANANVKTPTPTPKPSPSPSPTPSPSPSPDDEGNTATNGNTRPRSTPTPLPTPMPTRPAVNGGVLNGRATSLPTPSYPAAARASGLVRVQVLVDERGNVVSANAISGHPLLRAAAEQAARSSKISPAQVSGQPARTTGVLQYNFRAN